MGCRSQSNDNFSRKWVALTLLFERLIKWNCSHYFDIEVDSNDNATRVSCKLCTLYILRPFIPVEAWGREFHGTVIAHLMKYADNLDGLDFTRKGNIDKYDKSWEQYGKSIWKFNNNFVTKSLFHVIA